MSVPVPAAYTALIASDRVSAETREALLDRAGAETAGYRSQLFSPAAFRTLEAVLARTLPTAIDLAQRLDRALAEGTGDGWRFADLPPDPEAYRASLAALGGFAEQDPAAQEARLRAIEGGAEGQAMRRWFQDLRGDATKIYVAHPATLARIGYSGIAYGGSHPETQGFHDLEPGARPEWQPRPERGA